MSGYPPEMQESIRLVEATRPRRLKETFPTMTLEEREAILKAYHPDYKDETFRAIRVGVSKGQKMPLELADIVEGRPHIGPDFDLSSPIAETDVLVIGGGGAGSVGGPAGPASRAQRIILVTKLRLRRRQHHDGPRAASRPPTSPNDSSGHSLPGRHRGRAFHQRPRTGGGAGDGRPVCDPVAGETWG
jgi:hypothetical protein